jgi:hypothetical protein
MPPLKRATPCCLAPQSAACALLVVDHVDGAGAAHSAALRLTDAALRAGDYPLAADLLRCVWCI